MFKLLFIFLQTESEAIQKLKGTYKMRKPDEASKEPAAKKKKAPRPDAAAVNGIVYNFMPFAVGEHATGQAEQEETQNQILFISNIPHGYATVEMLSTLFSPHPGFKEVRLVPERPDIIFVGFA